MGGHYHDNIQDDIAMNARIGGMKLHKNIKNRYRDYWEVIYGNPRR